MKKIIVTLLSAVAFSMFSMSIAVFIDSIGGRGGIGFMGAIVYFLAVYFFDKA